MPEDKQDQAGGRPNWPRFWLILLGLLVLNWILGSLLMGAARPAVSYTFFLGQVNANNVQAITSTGDTIQGTFRHQVAYTSGSGTSGSGGSQEVQQFTTQRPTFANDNLFGKLQANGVTVNANPPQQGTPLWEELLLWFGPALLFGGLIAWWMRRGGAGALGGLGGMGIGKSKAKTRRCCARAGSTGGSRCPRRTSAGGGRSWPYTPAACRWPPMWIWTHWPQPPPAWSAQT